MSTVAVIQTAFGETPPDNIARVEKMVREAAAQGAQIVLPPELFERVYFCKTQRPEFLEYATPLADNAAVLSMRKVSAELNLVIPVSFFERAGNSLFNSLAMIDGGEVLGVYRKSHLPDGPGYQEKYYFSPGDTGFRVWQTRHGAIGAAICWDQWFPETARVLALSGADVLLYPTAIGSEPHLPEWDSRTHWQTVMRGHAAANMLPVAAANRIGQEMQTDTFGNEVRTEFYGSSFITDAQGTMLAEAARDADTCLVAELDFAANAKARREWGIFRDRRTSLYGGLLTTSGNV